MIKFLQRFDPIMTFVILQFFIVYWNCLTCFFRPSFFNVTFYSGNQFISAFATDVGRDIRRAVRKLLEFYETYTSTFYFAFKAENVCIKVHFRPGFVLMLPHQKLFCVLRNSPFLNKNWLWAQVDNEHIKNVNFFFLLERFDWKPSYRLKLLELE